jgi:nitrogen fixation-related uncharacterized protein
MTSFPIILIPPDLKLIEVTQPRQPILLKYKPTAPHPAQIKHVPHSPKKTSKSDLFKTLLITVALSLCLAHMLNIAFAIIIMIYLLWAIKIDAYNDNKSYPARLIKAQEEAKEIEKCNFQEKSRYKIDLDRYKEDFSEYELAFNNHQEELNTYLLPENVKKFRENLLLEYFRKTITPYILHEEERKNIKINTGISEKDFEIHLAKYFSIGEINTKTSVTTPIIGRNISGRTKYFPDFAYVHNSSGLCIDIEIDEPYIYVGNEPIHYIDIDENRNTAFLSMRWIVIRFAEVQVVKHPDRCCKLIAETIHAYLPSEELISKFSCVEDLPLVAQWTYQEAYDMAVESHRTTYICPDKIKQEKKRSDNTNKDSRCTRCNGTGYIAHFKHIERGRCFECN